MQRSLTERSGQPAPEAAWRLLDDPVATRDVLADLLEQCWQLLIAPHWPRLRDLLQADVLYRTRRLGGTGSAVPGCCSCQACSCGPIWLQ